MTVEGKNAKSAYLLSEVGIQDEATRLRKQATMMLALELPDILETLPANGRFVDLGCGAGLLADAVSQARPDAAVYGFDADALAVEQSRKHFGRADLIFDRRRLEEGPPPDFALADTAVLRLVLMHLPEPKKALEAAHAWLKPGGILHVIEGDDRTLVFEPDSPPMADILALMQKVQVSKGGSRWLGEELPALLGSSAWTVSGHRRHAHDPVLAAAALPAIFLPVAKYYLAEAERLGLATPESIQPLRRHLDQIGGGSFTGATIPLFHAWAHSSPQVAK
jgi:SAM-dependent methyltransferase